MPVTTKRPPESPEWLSSTEAAAFLDVHQSTLKRWRLAGLVPFVRHPGGRVRYSKQELIVWLDKRARGAR